MTDWLANNLAPARRAALAVAARSDRVVADLLGPILPIVPDTSGDVGAVSLRRLLTEELDRLEKQLRPSMPDGASHHVSDAAFFVRRRRVDALRHRMTALRTLPSILRKLALMPPDHCEKYLHEVGIAALAGAMSSVRPSELPMALHRLGPEAGRQVLQRVVDGPAVWPNELRRLVRSFYFGLDASLPGPAVLQAVGQAVLAVASNRLSEADRQALNRAATCDLQGLIRPADSAWVPFAEPLRMLARDALARTQQEAR